MSRHEIARAIDRIARRQHGVVTRAQALEAGMTARMIENRLDTGQWIALAPGVYALAAFPPTWRRQYTAAVLSQPGSAICSLAAARLLGFDGFNTVAPELVVGHTASHRSRLAVIRRAGNVEVTTVDGIAVTTPAQTLCDLVTRVRIDRWERACDGLLLERRMTIAELARRVDSYAGQRRPGIAALRALVDERKEAGWAPTESELEALLRRAVGEVSGCPPIRWQADLPWGRVGDGRVDGLIPQWRLILEADGRRWHARVGDFDRDGWRNNLAAAAGYQVLRFTHTHLAHRMAEVVELIESAGRVARTRRAA